jgi:peptidoglycan hydrolase-like protein with peptidoglycan-binding domain
VPTPPTISEGSRGEVVEWAQYLLVRFALSDNQIDGIFGTGTKAAVEQYQTFKHIGVDGIVGPITWGALTVLSRLLSRRGQREPWSSGFRQY